MFIVLEGIDACGKDTQGELLQNFYAKRYPHKQVKLLKFPCYTSPTGQLILSHLKEEWQCMKEISDAKILGTTTPYTKASVDAQVFQCVHFVDKISNTPPELWQNRPDHIFIVVRYWPSSFVYGKADGCDPKWLQSINSVLPTPDFCILLDISPELSVQRRPDRRDRYETQSGLMRDVRSNYKELFKEYKDHNWHVIDASVSVDEVTNKILDITGR